MEKIKVIIRIVIIPYFILALTACTQKIGQSKLQEAYDSTEAIKRGDIVAKQVKLMNFERFEEFLHNLEKNKEDHVRITSYTIEGDPIFDDLSFDGKEILYTHDTTHDEYGENKVETDSCKGIIKRVKEEGTTEYYATSCSKNGEILLIQVEN